MSVRIERDGPVTTVIIDRPSVRNAVDTPTAEALDAAFHSFEADDESSVAVLCGDHGAFCAGFDLKFLAESELSADVRQGDHGPMGPTRRTLNKPVIAAVAGHAVAGGLELALWCDLRVVEETAVMGVFCRRWGVPLLDGGTVRLPRLVGMGRALDLILTGRPVAADEALAIGLADRVVGVGEARTAAEALARDIARFPQICMRADRLSAHRQWNMELDDALQAEGRGGLQALTDEGQAGASRFAAGAGRHGDFNK